MRERCTALPAVLLAAGWIATAPVAAQQFVDSTALLFPNPNPAEYTNQVTVGDLDGDGDLDLVFANGGNFSSPGSPEKVRVFINFGNGFFKDQSDLRTGGHAGLYRGVELGDCDRDGDLDIVLAQDFDRLPELLINSGPGVFTAEGATRLPPITLSSSRGQFGDVDNDGDLDLFFTSGDTTRFGCGQYRLYLNDGTCHFTDVTAAQFPLGNVCENMDCIFGDIDNDFDLDIRTASRGTNNSRLYRNDGTGTFTVVAGVPPDSTCYSYDFGDMDGDGDLDLLGANGQPGSSGEILLENDGTGGYTDVSSRLSPNPSDDDNDSKFFDYDDDGDLDLIIARLGGSSEKIYRNDGAGNFTLVTGVITAVTDSSLDVAVADLDGNGSLDVVTAQGESGAFENRIYINTGPLDTEPPRIVRTEPLADTTDEAGPYVARALILDQMTSDRNFVDGGISLAYSVDGGAEQTVPMLHSGGQVYRGALPGQAAGSLVEYHVIARDRSLNTAVGPVLSFRVLFDCAAVGDCSGHGACVGPATCDCDPGWGGPDCSAAASDPAGDVAGLVVDRADPSVVLAWSPSCRAGDSDYAIYSGALGSFDVYTPVTCTTEGATSAEFGPEEGDRFYLVVPRNATSEGSYGRASDSVERPPSGAACLAQSIGSCL